MADNCKEQLREQCAKIVKQKEHDFLAMQKGLRVRGQRFVHDCEACRWVGRYDNPRNGHQRFDVWVCGDPSNLSVIARYSSRGPDYMSMKLDTYREAEEESFRPETAAYLAVVEWGVKLAKFVDAKQGEVKWHTD